VAPFTREVIEGSTNGIGAASPQTVAGAAYTFASWSNAGAVNHTTVVNADTTLTATFERSTVRQLAGTDIVGAGTSVALPGMAEAYRTVATESGTATELHLYVAGSSTASALVLGLYAGDDDPTTLLGSGRTSNPTPGAWNKVDVDIPGIVAGRKYWIGLLNPADATGELRWRAHEAGEPEQQIVGGALGQLPTIWQADRLWPDGGPLSGYVVGTPPTSVPSPPPVPPALDPPPPFPTPPPSGPVGAWGFDETGGTAALDASGSGNRGRVSGPTRTAGRYGGGLSFDGAGDWVTVPDADSLDLGTGMTLEAWVRPTARGSTWRSVIVKEHTSRLAYGLYASSRSRPSAHVYTDRDRALRGRSPLRLRRWSHLAMTWDGSTMRTFVNGKRVASGALSGAARASTGPLRIGGNAVWPEWFRGVIDEVRVYDRALSAAEIARDRDTRINLDAPTVTTRTATRRAEVRETRRAVHRTRWLNGSGGAARSG
jgi:hypothetical protein